jgi:hypothetical protein
LSEGERLNLLLRPPSGLIAAPVERAMVEPAERHGKLVADATADRRTLRKP